jgi:hypothetical protein
MRINNHEPLDALCHGDCNVWVGMETYIHELQFHARRRVFS